MKEGNIKRRPIFTIEQVDDNKVCLRVSLKRDGDKNAIREGLYHAMEENDEMADLILSSIIDFVVDNFSSKEDIGSLFDDVKDSAMEWYDRKNAPKKPDFARVLKGGGMPS